MDKSLVPDFKNSTQWSGQNLPPIKGKSGYILGNDGRRLKLQTIMSDSALTTALGNITTALNNILASIDDDVTLSADSDSRVATQHATKTYADTKEVPLTFSGGLSRSIANVVTANLNEYKFKRIVLNYNDDVNLSVTGDDIVRMNVSGKTATLPTTSGNSGNNYTIINTSSGDITIATIGGDKIYIKNVDSGTSVTLASGDSCLIIAYSTWWELIKLDY
jgi:hypothetical protein